MMEKVEFNNNINNNNNSNLKFIFLRPKPKESLLQLRLPSPINSPLYTQESNGHNTPDNSLKHNEIKEIILQCCKENKQISNESLKVLNEFIADEWLHLLIDCSLEQLIYIITSCQNSVCANVIITEILPLHLLNPSHHQSVLKLWHTCQHICSLSESELYAWKLRIE